MCFNGAVTFSLRKLVQEEITLNPDGSMLQWGRNFFVTEICAAAGLSRNDILLQWGRNFFVTEIFPHGKGKPVIGWLQWGRNFFVTEI